MMEKNQSCSSGYRPLILIGDEDTEFLSMLLDAVRGYDRFDVETAKTGQEIIDCVNSSCYDALVLEIKFPDILGTTIASLIHDVDSDLPIALLSQYDGKAATFGVVRSDSTFWYKSFNYTAEELELLCEKMYLLALTSPCNREERDKQRKAQKEINKTTKIEIPNILLQAIKGNQYW